MFLNPVTFLMKNLSLQGRCFVTLNNRSLSFLSNPTIRSLSYDNNPESHRAEKSGDEDGKTTIPQPPQRFLTTYALFIQDYFPKLKETHPDLTPKERFNMAGDLWRGLSDEEKESYKNRFRENVDDYKNEMKNYIDSLTGEELEEFNKLKQIKIRNKTRHKIKAELKNLNYPKRSVSSYIFYIRHSLLRDFPDGIYPPVRSQEHIEYIKARANEWRLMSYEEKKPFFEEGERDRERYFKELEAFKISASKPENEEKVKKLEKLSRKYENTKKTEEELKNQRRKESAAIIQKNLARKLARLKAKIVNDESKSEENL